MKTSIQKKSKSLLRLFYKNEEGAIAIEFVLIFPVVLFLMMAGLDLMRFIHMQNKLSQMIESVGKAVQYRGGRLDKHFFNDADFDHVIRNVALPTAMFPYEPDGADSFPIYIRIAAFASEQHGATPVRIDRTSFTIGNIPERCETSVPNATTLHLEPGEGIFSVCGVAQYKSIFANAFPLLNRQIVKNYSYFEAYRAITAIEDDGKGK